MRTIELTYDVEQAPDALFAFLTDFAQLRRWRTLDDLRVEPAGPLNVGSRLFTRVKGPGRTMTFTNEVTRLDPTARVYDDRAIDGTFLIESGWQVEPNGTGSRIHWTTRFQPRGLMIALAPVLGRVIRQGQLKDLATLKRIVEPETGTQ